MSIVEIRMECLKMALEVAQSRPTSMEYIRASAEEFFQFLQQDSSK